MNQHMQGELTLMHTDSSISCHIFERLELAMVLSNNTSAFLSEFLRNYSV